MSPDTMSTPAAPADAITAPAVPIPPMPARYGAISGEPHPVPAVPEGVVPPELWRQEIANPYPDRNPTDIVVDPDAAFLFLILPEGRALRYGVSVGRAGFAWAGESVVQFTRSWPRWKVPDTMIARQPELAPYSVNNGGMAGGPGNPLGARALYLFQDGVDTLYRIHGGSEPEYLGKAVSSGCIRMLDQDAIDLEQRVRHHARVLVLPSFDNGNRTFIY
ncbi:L,D-transpeptidase [uncultured Paracoccus sp.]|nr:L,D-transpeptidase [uncultured Paracoccus sp.]